MENIDAVCNMDQFGHAAYFAPAPIEDKFTTLNAPHWVKPYFISRYFT